MDLKIGVSRRARSNLGGIIAHEIAEEKLNLYSRSTVVDELKM